MGGPWKRLGLVRAVNPARRELRVASGPAGEGSVRIPATVRVTLPGGNVLACRVEAATVRRNGLTLRLGPGATRDCVAQMKGSLVEIAQDALDGNPAAFPPLQEWIGYTVVDGRGAIIGRVTGAIEAPANDVLEIEQSGGGRLLLPVITQTVESVDGAAGRIVVGDIAAFVLADAN